MRTWVLALAFMSYSLVGTSASSQPTESSAYRLVATYPHDNAAFTQGLDFDGGRFLETTGLNGESTLRRVNLETGEVRKKVALADRHFGEGMTVIRNRLWWITWQSERAFVYDPDTFERRRSVSYQGEGWGLTHNGRRLIMSNGSDELVFRHPRTFDTTRRMRVRDGTTPITNLNELEWVEGEIFANIWMEDRIARIDPASGEVTGWIDISALKAMEPDGNETNGIAYLKQGDRLFVTGKNWSHVYEIELIS